MYYFGGDQEVDECEKNVSTRAATRDMTTYYGSHCIIVLFGTTMAKTGTHCEES
jgi:hypothetical protein